MNITAFYYFESTRFVSVIIFAQMVGARSTSFLRAAGSRYQGVPFVGSAAGLKG